LARNGFKVVEGQSKVARDSQNAHSKKVIQNMDNDLKQAKALFFDYFAMALSSIGCLPFATPWLII
jgi:type II secretory pathway component PulF